MLADRERLIRVAGLLASDKLGERAAAAAKATDILKRAGMTWEDALRPIPAPTEIVLVAAEPNPLEAENERLRAALKASENHRQILSDQLQAAQSVFWMGVDGKPWL